MSWLAQKIVDAIIYATQSIVTQLVTIAGVILTNLWHMLEYVVESVWSALAAFGVVAFNTLMAQLGIDLTLDFGPIMDTLEWLDTFLPVHEILIMLKAYTSWQFFVTAFRYVASFRPF